MTITVFYPAEDGCRIGPVEKSVEDDVQLEMHLRADTCGKNGSIQFKTRNRQEFDRSDTGL